MLLNKRELADRLDVDRRFVTAMSAHGFQFLLGGKTTLDDALAWLREKGPACRRRHPSRVATSHASPIQPGAAASAAGAISAMCTKCAPV